MIDLLRWGMDVDYPTKVSSNGEDIDIKMTGKLRYSINKFGF